MNTSVFISSRPRIAKLQRYERRRAKALHYFDRLLALTWTGIGLAIIYLVLIGLTGATV